MKNQIDMKMAAAAIAVLVVLVVIIGIKVFGGEKGDTKPPPEKVTQMQQQQQAMKHYMATPQFNGAAANSHATGQSADQAAAMQKYYRDHPQH